MRIIRYISIIGALPVTNAFYFTVNSRTLSCKGDPFLEKVVTHQCVESRFYGKTEFYGPKCYWGDTLMITGSLIAISNFPTNGQVTVIPEIINWQRYNSYDMQSIGRACQFLVPLDGQTCGDPGEYGINIQVDLPQKTESWYQSALDSVTSITIHFENSVTCNEMTSQNLTMPGEVSGVGMGMMFGALFAVWNGRRRRRYTQQQENTDDDSDGEMDRYVEMRDRPNKKGTRAADPVVQWRRSDSVIDAMEQHRAIYGDDMIEQYSGMD